MELVDRINAAWPSTPYPGDHVLSDCWCDECQLSVSSIRGKSWPQLKIEDTNSETCRLSTAAFLYYLPALLTLSLRYPEELHLSGLINGRFIRCDIAPSDGDVEIHKILRRLSKVQKHVLNDYLEWQASQGWQPMLLIEPAKVALATGRVEPFSYDKMMQWCRDRERHIRAEQSGQPEPPIARVLQS
jgi:hypothetical protein